MAAQTAAVTAKMGESMAKANEAMAAMGKTNDPAKIAATMQQFQKENAKMEMGQEMMDDSLDGIWDDEDTEAETTDLMNQVRPHLSGTCADHYWPEPASTLYVGHFTAGLCPCDLYTALNAAGTVAPIISQPSVEYLRACAERLMKGCALLSLLRMANKNC